MKCLKCQNDTFDTSIILTRIIGETAVCDLGENNFEVLTCKKCHLTQWYDRDLISDKTKPEKKHEETQYVTMNLPAYKCGNCKNLMASNKRISPLEDSLSLEGEILARLCAKCGLVELYQILLVFSNFFRGSGRGQTTLLKQRAELAKSFNCPICASKSVDQTGGIVFSRREPQPVYLARLTSSFILVTCGQCKYIMMFAYL